MAGNVGIGTTSPGALLEVAGTTIQNGLKTTVFQGHSVGNETFYVDVPVGDEGGEGQYFKIEATFAHYATTGYNCVREFYVGARGTVVELLNVYQVDSANGGGWTASKPDASTLRITKSAGSYSGGGKYWIRVTSPTSCCF